MKVKELLKSSAKLLGVEINKENESFFEDCYNLVENELALEYFPLRAVDIVFIENNKIKYADLKNNPFRILSIKDFQGEDVKYKLYPKHIKIEKNYEGCYFFVRYNYIPKEKTINDESSYTEYFEDIFKYGICSEYCLIQGNFDAAREFSKKYKNCIYIGYIMKGAKNGRN